MVARSSQRYTKPLLDAIAAGDLDGHLAALARYLATVIELDDHGATIPLEAPIGRFKSGRVRCPPLALEKLR